MLKQLQLLNFTLALSCHSGWHSDQGSQTSGIVWEIRLWKNISGDTARLFAENFDARLAGIVIWTDCPLLGKKNRRPSNSWKSTKLTIYVFKNPRGVIFQKQKRLRQAHRPRGGGLTPKIQVQTSKYKSRQPNTSPDSQIQVQTAKYKSRHPKQKSRHLKYNIWQYIVTDMAIYRHIWPYIAIYTHIWPYI